MTIIGVAFFALRESFHLLRELQFLTLLFQKKERNEFRGKKKLWIFCHFSANLDLTGGCQRVCSENNFAIMRGHE